jgi:hypothetical protein
LETSKLIRIVAAVGSLGFVLNFGVAGNAQNLGNSIIVEAKSAPNIYSHDLVVYGGSPAGVIAAVAASRRGLSVALLSQSPTVGGTISNGLGATDVLVPSNVSGIPLEFFNQVKTAYNNKDAWRVTPKLAEQIFRKMLASAKVQVWLNVSATQASIVSGKITCLTVRSKSKFCAKQFIDASYPADLLPLTKTKFKLGKQDLFDYGDNVGMDIAFKPRLTLTEELSDEQEKSISSLPFMQHPKTFSIAKVKLTDGMPSFTYRFCVSTGNKRPFKLDPRDAKYIPAWKVLVAAFTKKPCVDCEEDDVHKVTRFWRMGRVSGDKWDLNSLNSFTNFPLPASYFSDHSSRAKTNALAARYIESLVAFMQSDPDVDKVEKSALEGFGMCADEFTDNNNVPYEPYVREGRRVIGKYVMLTTDEKTNITKQDSIGIGMYHIDNKLSISVRYKNRLYRDYTSFQKSKIYEIPYSITVPKTGPKNLLVAVGVSTSPLAYGSIRMEPHYMLIGQATGVAAALAIQNDVPVGQIPVTDLQSILRSWSQKLSLNSYLNMFGCLKCSPTPL